MPNINCQFNIPVNLGDEVNPDWEYSVMECDQETLQLLENQTTEAEFYIQKTINYGEILVITFLTIFLVFGILKFLTDFLVPKLINFRRK